MNALATLALLTAALFVARDAPPAPRLVIYGFSLLIVAHVVWGEWRRRV